MRKNLVIPVRGQVSVCLWDAGRGPQSIQEALRRQEAIDRLKEPDPALLQRSLQKNTIVSAGLTALAKMNTYGYPSPEAGIRYIAVGTGNALPTVGDTALGSEVAGSRIQFDSYDDSSVGAASPAMVYSLLYDTSEANGDLIESGLFYQSSGAPMFARALFDYKAITGATNADPCVITSAAHGLSNGDYVLITDVGGMTELNTNKYYVGSVATNTFALYSDSGLTTTVNSSAYGAYTSGGYWKLVYEKTSSKTMSVAWTITYPSS